MTICRSFPLYLCYRNCIVIVRIEKLWEVFMIFGYVRESMHEQNLARQLDSLRVYNCDNIVIEKSDGSFSHRPALDTLLKKMHQGDTLIVESFSQIGRTIKSFMDMVDICRTNDVKLICIREDFASGTQRGRLVLSVFQSFCEINDDDFEVTESTEKAETARMKFRVARQHGKFHQMHFR